MGVLCTYQLMKNVIKIFWAIAYALHAVTSVFRPRREREQETFEPHHYNKTDESGNSELEK